MSADPLREGFWKSTARSTIKERCMSIFNQELLSDVKFIIQDSEGESEHMIIPAHKFVLAISSPVFFAMFYGELAETKDSIEISDCEYESLFELFRFIYTDEVNLNPDNVMQLMYLAKKYMLPSLADKCSAFLQENLDPSNVFHVLPAAQKYEEKDLLYHCWKVIEKDTEEAVKSGGFVTIERSVLEELVEKYSLNIKEVELFKALDYWTEKECEKQGLVAEGSVKRRILGERIVKGIRFPVMEQKEFVGAVLDRDILSNKECFDMMKYFNGVQTIPVGFCGTKRAVHLNLISRFSSLRKGWLYSSGLPNCIGLSVDKNITLHAVRLFGSENSKYSVTLTVEDANGEFVGIKECNILSRHMQSNWVGDYPGLDVVFVPPLLLKANTGYYRFEAKIIGPPSWYGGRGLSRVDCGGVTFFFESYTSLGFHTSVETGQFSEFVFTLE